MARLRFVMHQRSQRSVMIECYALLVPSMCVCVCVRGGGRGVREGGKGGGGRTGAW